MSVNYEFKDLNNADAIVFDCDGVLIDVSNSYDATIKQTVTYILGTLNCGDLIIDHKLIDAFKATGGFNDEVDLTYAAIICSIAAFTTNKDPYEFTINTCKSIDSTGINAIEQYALASTNITKFIAKLGYPGKTNSNIIHDTFNQIFYGQDLYYKLYNRKSKFNKQGKIDSDRLLVNQQTMHTFYDIFKKSSPLVTGRSKASFQYSVQNPLRLEFDMSNSVFLEDKPRSLAKPNPKSLIQTIRNINSKLTIYVGDSIEDLLLAKGAANLGYPTIFCGITGTSNDKNAKKTLFEKNGAHTTCDTVNSLAKILNPR